MQADRVRELLQDLEIVDFDIHRLASRRHNHENWSGWTPKARDRSGIHRELDNLYEKKRLITGEIEMLARNRANSRAESLEVSGAGGWRGTGIGLWERCLEMALRPKPGKFVLHANDKQPKGL